MASPRKYHHGDLRKKLIETALEIISVEGLEKVSMRGLGNRIGVSRMAPYRHFANKSELLSAIAEEGFRILTRKLGKVNNRDSDDSLARLVDIGIAYVEFAVTNPVHYRMMFGNEIQEADRPLSLQESAATSFKEHLKAVALCMEQKKIRPLDPLIVANMLWAAAHGISSLLIDGQVPAENAFQTLPALLQKKGEGAAPDIPRIFADLSQIVFTGLIENSSELWPSTVRIDRD